MFINRNSQGNDEMHLICVPAFRYFIHGKNLNKGGAPLNYREIKLKKQYLNTSVGSGLVFCPKSKTWLFLLHESTCYLRDKQKARPDPACVA
jgi:hypothetical protein